MFQYSRILKKVYKKDLVYFFPVLKIADPNTENFIKLDNS